MNTQETFVYLVAPTCAGKGFLMKLMQRTIRRHAPEGTRGGVEFVSFGDIIRRLLKEDPSFRERYGDSIAKGRLVDDPTANEIFANEIRRLRDASAPSLFIVDGFCRSTPQIAFAANNGFLDALSKVFMIDASIETCADRFGHRTQQAPGRIDAELPTLHYRYHLHMDMVPDLRSMFKESECLLIDIDGNRGIPDEIFPEILGNLIEDFAQVLKRDKSIDHAVRTQA